MLDRHVRTMRKAARLQARVGPQEWSAPKGDPGTESEDQRDERQLLLLRGQLDHLECQLRMGGEAKRVARDQLRALFRLLTNVSDHESETVHGDGVRMAWYIDRLPNMGTRFGRLPEASRKVLAERLVAVVRDTSEALGRAGKTGVAMFRGLLWDVPSATAMTDGEIIELVEVALAARALKGKARSGQATMKTLGERMRAHGLAEHSDDTWRRAFRRKWPVPHK